MPGDEQEPAEAPPRVRVGGLFAFQATSRVRFLVSEGTPELPAHRLVATYAFPDRCRWQLEPWQPRPGGRRIVYRFGPRAWLLDHDDPRSRPLESSEAAETLTSLELRRAAMTWPHGFDWDGGEPERSAPLPGGGRLIARLEPGSSRPNEIESRDASGALLQGLRDLEWSERAGRHWPASFVLEAGGRPVWHEELLEIDVSVRHVDAFFMPHDRRPPGVPGAAAIVLAESRRLALRRVPLAPATDWPSALARFDEVRAEAAGELAPLELEQVPRFELDAEGRPVALLLTLGSGLPDELPVGFVLEPAGSTLSAVVSRPTLIDAGLLARLRAGIPEGSRSTGPIRARVQRQPRGGAPTRVLLNLDPDPEGDG